jgi:hypothetical protein
VDIVAPPFDVDSRDLSAATRIWGAGTENRITLYRLGTLQAQPRPEGKARTATSADRERLADWYDRMMAASPGDPSDLAYVVDAPLSYGGITLWEVDGVPVAMAVRSRLVAGMVRLGAVYPDDVHGRAAFAEACARAKQEAVHVLVFAPSPDNATYLDLGFAPVLDRVLLGP